ncbi:ABC transporter ATP-binding protein [Anaerococcus sp. Marseille-P3625]|uniref:ABC transporter ATP-binding protein n=1 Tax=Anaerococcus sp. Marseille-P3625 TaxID=1977277 RepID=UPI002151B9D6|nr:ABC transporter ATP-binding protein [Anaerococcus sp. Marseille-P3625]
MMYLEIKNLSKTYGKNKVLDDINIDLEKGKFLCLLGPSGSGKSTILHAIGGFIDHEGSIFLDEEDITDKDPNDRKVATVFQSLGLFSHMTVMKNVMYGLKFNQKSLTNKEKEDLALKTIEMVGLKGYENRKPSELSGGEKQRVALARSLVVKPKILLMDEPFSALDQKLRERMQLEIRKIHKEFKLTTIFVTHDQAEAFKMADEVIVLNKGKIIDRGNPSKIYNHPSNKESLDFIGQKNFVNDSYVRPEKITFADDGEEFTITDIIFVGSFVELYLSNDLRKLKMLTLNNNFDKKIGDKVKVSYEMEKIS